MGSLQTRRRRAAGRPVGELSVAGRYSVALSGTDVAQLRALAGDRSVQVRRALARNPATPLGVSHTLTDDKDPQVLIGLAGRADVPASLLAKVASRPRLSPDVAWVLAGNPAIAAAALTVLCGSGEPQVRRRAAAHASCTPELLRSLLLADPGVAADAWACVKPPAGWFRPADVLGLAGVAHRVAEVDRKLFTEMAASWSGTAQDLIAALADVAR